MPCEPGKLSSTPRSLGVVQKSLASKAAADFSNGIVILEGLFLRLDSKCLDYMVCYPLPASRILQDPLLERLRKHQHLQLNGMKRTESLFVSGHDS
jgi:hypothetical protein